MSFPNVTVECAFNNDYDESINAQTGYTDITQFVKTVNGNLRGRTNETGRIEAGTISVDLDNEDGRFTPSRPSSPYYPNVKSNRRFRIRGKNMLPPNIATTGGKEQSTSGFRVGSALSDLIGSPQYGELGAFAVTPGADKAYIYNIYPAGVTGWKRLIEWYGPIELGVRLVHSAFIWRLQGTEVAGAMARFEVHYLDADDNEITTTVVAPHSDISQPIPTSATQTVFSHTPPANAKTALMTVAYYSPTAPTTDIYIAVSAAQTELPDNLAPNPSGYHDILGWNVEGAADQSLTLPTVSGTTSLILGTGTRTTSALTTAANDWVIVQIIVENNDSENSYVAAITSGLNYSPAVDSNGSAAGNKARVITWIAQDTVGGSRTVQLSPQVSTKNYTARVTVVHNSDGLGVAAYDYAQQIEVERQRSNSLMMMQVGDYTGGSVTGVTWTPTSTTIVSSGQSAGVLSSYYARVGNAGAYYSGLTNVYGLTAPTVASPTIAVIEMLAKSSGITNAGPQQDVTNQAVRIDWAAISLATDNARAGIDIPHLIPGETYSLSLEVKKVGTQAYLMSLDDGQTGVTINATTFTQFNQTFVADTSEQTLSFFPQADVNYGDSIYFRRLNVKKGTTSPGLAPAYGPITDSTAWEYPKPIFEGWVERWPAVVGSTSTSMSITVVDRLKRVGTIELSNVLGEILYADNMDLIVPFNDSPTDSQGAVSQIGTWADDWQLTQIKFQASKGDIGASSYVLGIDGPTDETALDLNPISSNLGYSLPIPYSASTITTPKPAPKPAPGNPTTTPTPTAPKTYTKTYYATWSRTFDSSGSVTFDDTPYLYQGFFSGDRGNNRSLIGFNSAQIRADLSGASVKGMKLTMHNAHWYYNGGGVTVIGTHTYSSKPGSWSGASVTDNRAQSRAWPKGGTATATLTVGFANLFKTGAAKGIALGPGPTTALDYYGYFNGATQSNRPSITITFVK